MWMDKKGVAHSVAIPRPRRCVARKFVVQLRRHRKELDDEFLGCLEDRSIAEFTAVRQQFSRRKLRGRALPANVKIGKGCADPDVAIRDVAIKAIDQVPVQWRLDAVMVLGDILDAWES